MPYFFEFIHLFAATAPINPEKMLPAAIAKKCVLNVTFLFSISESTASDIIKRTLTDSELKSIFPPHVLAAENAPAATAAAVPMYIHMFPAESPIFVKNISTDSSMSVKTVITAVTRNPESIERSFIKSQPFRPQN